MVNQNIKNKILMGLYKLISMVNIISHLLNVYQEMVVKIELLMLKHIIYIKGKYK